MRLTDAGIIALVATGAPLVWRTLRGIAQRRFATDVVASLAIIAAVALREPVAGLVVVLMVLGGEWLERFAARRATRAIEALEDASPRTAHVLRDGVVHTVAAESIAVGDYLLVRAGELVPADGVVEMGASLVDASRLTGESVPVTARPGVRLMSGSINGDSPLHLRATARAAESQYARIVQLVRSAQASKAPLQRLADRYAAWFTPLTLIVCSLTFAFTGDWHRVLAVLVVATPCPLILATPVAIVGGISHAARHGIIVRHGGALEALGRVNVAVFDKTGTLTVGRPEVSRVVPVSRWDTNSLMRLSAAVEQGSGHLLGRSIVADAARRNGGLPPAHNVVEAAGRGVIGDVGPHRVAVGSRSYLADSCGVSEATLRAMENGHGALRAFVVVDGEAAGTIEFADAVRPDVADVFRRLRHSGITRTVLLSGDQARYVEAVASELGITEARGDLLPEDKVGAVGRIRRAGHHVMMVGDGVNDAPALSAADVGIALAAHGGSLASESADVILLEDDLSGVAEAVEIGRRTMRIARQSIVVGLGLSAAAMAFAAFGFIAPVAGALLQEAIDVAVIVNALRTSR